MKLKNKVPERVACARTNASGDNWSKAFGAPPGANVALLDHVAKVFLDTGIMQNGLRKEPRTKTVKDFSREAHVTEQTGNGLVGAINAEGQLANDSVEGGNQINKDLS